MTFLHRLIVLCTFLAAFAEGLATSSSQTSKVVQTSTSAPSTCICTTTSTIFRYETLTSCATGSTSLSSSTGKSSKLSSPSTTPTRSTSASASQGTANPTDPTQSSNASGQTEPIFDGCRWNVAGVGKFANKKVYTFFEDGLPNGLAVSDYTVHEAGKGPIKWNRKFVVANVYSDGDFLNLKVSGNSSKYTDQAIPGGEIETIENDILYGSVRINAIFSDVPGTCHGFFFYRDDTQETDIEYLTDPQSQGNNINQTSSAGDPIPIWYSNQSLNPPAPATQETGPPPWDVTAVHEYRIDWTKTYTAFYLDGVLQKKYTTNVPTKPSYFIINNWSNGDPNWSAGPPQQDNVLKVQNITMYYNTTKDPQNC